MTSSKRTNRWRAGCGLALLAGASFGCSAENTANPPIDDVDTAWDCKVGADGVLRAAGTVTNHSSKASFYMVTVDFALGGRSFDSVTTTADHVAPGESIRLEASVSDPPSGEHDCFVSGVERFKD